MSAASSALRRPVLGEVFATTRVRQAALVLGCTLAIALAAQLRIPLPVGPVPITAQTLIVLLAGASLGPSRALASAALYLGLGVAGVPWFAVSGGATLGYLVGFAVAAVVVGAGARAGHDRRVRSAVPLMVLGSVLILAFGAAGLMLVVGLSFEAALAGGVVPFLVGDTIKVAIAAALLPGAWRLVAAIDRERS